MVWEVLGGLLPIPDFDHGLTQSLCGTMRVLSSGYTAEIVIAWDERNGATLTMKAYRNSARDLYPGFDHIPFGVDWASADEEIVDAFLEQMEYLERFGGQVT